MAVSIALLAMLVLLAASVGSTSAMATESYQLSDSGSGQADPDAIGYSGWLATGCVLLFVGVPAATIRLVRRHREHSASQNVRSLVSIWAGKDRPRSS